MIVTITIPQFIDRQDELQALNELLTKKRAALVLLYGRRRVGKTRLIQEFMKDKRGLYFYVPNAEEKTVLAQFSRVVESEFFEGFRFAEYLSSNSGFKSRPRTKIRDRTYIHGFSITDAWNLGMEIW